MHLIYLYKIIKFDIKKNYKKKIMDLDHWNSNVWIRIQAVQNIFVFGSRALSESLVWIWILSLICRCLEEISPTL